MDVMETDNTLPIAIGASVGGLLLLVALAALVLFLLRRRRNSGESADTGVAMHSVNQAEVDSAQQEAQSEAESSRNIYHDVTAVRPTAPLSANQYGPSPVQPPADLYTKAPLHPAGTHQ
jgi:hypothetical protein